MGDPMPKNNQQTPEKEKKKKRIDKVLALPDRKKYNKVTIIKPFNKWCWYNLLSK